MLDQNLPDRELSISITKIFNWPTHQANNNHFDLIFYPEQIDWAPIIQKSIPGSFLSNSMLINAYLKISYTLEQKIVIMKMFNLGNLLGEFTIDLESLKDKKVQYFTFGSNQVLQVNVYTPNKAPKLLENQNQTVANKAPSKKNYPSQPKQQRNEDNYLRVNNQRMNMQMQYYEEEISAEEQRKSAIHPNRYGPPKYPRNQQMTYSRKQPYESNYQNVFIRDEERSNRSRISYYDDEDTSVRGGARRNSALRYQNANMYPHSPDYQYSQHRPIRKSFSEKVLSLLHEVKIMKDELSNSRITSGDRSNTGGHANNDRNFMKNKKSMSETNLMKTKSYYSPNLNPQKADNIKSTQNGSNNTYSYNGTQKHRLILDSLNVVPYDEYYEKNNPQQNFPQRAPQSPQANQNFYYRSKVR